MLCRDRGLQLGLQDITSTVGAFGQAQLHLQVISTLGFDVHASEHFSADKHERNLNRVVMNFNSKPRPRRFEPYQYTTMPLSCILLLTTTCTSNLLALKARTLTGT